jgi:hypothetical protein
MLSNVKTEKTTVLPSLLPLVKRDKRASVEILLRNGNRRHYRCKAQTQYAALKEVLTFIQSIEVAEGEQVYWRFKGEKVFHYGSQMPQQYSRLEKIKNKIYNFIFDEDC